MMSNPITDSASAEYVPSLDTIRGRYCDGTYVQTGLLTEGLEFDRAIAKLRADTLLGAANALETVPGGQANDLLSAFGGVE